MYHITIYHRLLLDSLLGYSPAQPGLRDAVSVAS